MNSATIINAIQQAITKYGTFHFHDGRVHEVMNLQPIVEWINQQEVATTIQTMREVVGRSDLGEMGHLAVLALLDEMQRQLDLADSAACDRFDALAISFDY